jgi:hypothetical protein
VAEAKIFFQPGEPTDRTPGTQWFLPDGTWRLRGTDGAWRRVGNANLETVGHLDRQGGHMEGAIEGNHGLAPLNAPNFSTNALLEDADLATKSWVQAQLKALSETLTNAITAATDGSTPDFTLYDTIAFGFGTIGHGEAIPLPRYKLGKGTTAKISEVVLVTAAPSALDGYNHQFDGFAFHDACSVEKGTLVVTCHRWGDSHYDNVGVASYIILCAKTPS